MSDDLVKRLRSKIIVYTDVAVWILEAADRIEELEAKLDAMAEVLVEAMIVPEVWMMAGFPDMSSEAREQITASVMKARTTIEELKKEAK